MESLRNPIQPAPFTLAVHTPVDSYTDQTHESQYNFQSGNMMNEDYNNEEERRIPINQAVDQLPYDQQVSNPTPQNQYGNADAQDQDYQISKYDENYRKLLQPEDRYQNPGFTQEQEQPTEFQTLPENPQEPIPEIDQVVAVPENPAGVSAIGVHPPGPIKIKPVSLPVGPNPEMCPCYIVESKNTTSPPITTTTPSAIIEPEINEAPIYGQLAFIPVIFVPYCPGDDPDSEGMTRAMFPTATPVPYPCNVCDRHQESPIAGGRSFDLGQLSNIKAIRRVLTEAKLGYLNVPSVSAKSSRSRSHRRKVKRRKSTD